MLRPDDDTDTDELKARVERAKATHAALAIERFPMTDEDGLSNLTVGGNRLTWQEAADYWREQAQAAGRLASLLSDLDRCEHGRHEGDPCTLRGGCGGPSHGNPLAHDRRIGYSLSGRPIVIPEGHHLNEPDAWMGATDAG